MKDPPQHRFEFGSFCFDEAQHLLTRDGSPISLPPKCFGLLCVLVKNPGQLLEKSRLMHELWPETFVEEANLSNTVALLRKALGDEAGTAQYVQTIPRIGYRFIARVKALPNGEESSDGHRLPIRILVFPFRCSSGAGEPEHLAYGLAEAISSTLAELNTFTVRSMQLAMRFDLIHWYPGIVATEADVDVILSGTLDRSCDRIHAITQLIAARSGTLLWARSWDIEANDLFHFHQGVVQLIMRFFFRSTSGDIPQALPADALITSEAYELYLRATQLSLKRSPESAALARDMYIACVEKDPNYAPAWARLGRCYRFLDKLGAETDKDGRAA